MSCILAGGIRHRRAMKADRTVRPRLPEIRELQEFRDLRGILREGSAEGVRFTEALPEDLRNLLFTECELDHAFFSGNGRGCRFTDVIFRGCDFSNAVLDETSFCRCLFEQCRMLGTSLIRASFRDVTVRDSVFDYANFSGSQWNTVQLADCRFQEAALAMCTLKQTGFHRCDLSRAELNDTKLAGLDFSDCEIGGIMVKPQDLTGLAVNRDQAVVFAALLGLNVTD